MKLICFDLDGTLLDENEMIHPNDVELLSFKNTSNFIVSTGRALPSIKGVFNLNGLFSREKIPFPILSQNGAVLYGPEEQLLEFNAFDAETQNQLLNHIGKFRDIPFFLFGENEVFLLNPNQQAFEYASIWFYPLEKVKVAGFPPVSKMMALSWNKERLDEINNLVQDLEIEIFFSLDFLLEITPRGIDKGNGLMKLLSLLNMNEGNVFYAGDGENDLPGFDISNKSFAPITASQHVKSRADLIIDTHENGLLFPILQEAKKV